MQALYRYAIFFRHTTFLDISLVCNFHVLDANLWLQDPVHEDLPRFIATQGPLPSTAGDLWTMVLQQRCPIIVMLTRVVDGDQVSKVILSRLEMVVSYCCEFLLLKAKRMCKWVICWELWFWLLNRLHGRTSVPFTSPETKTSLKHMDGFL
jgi:hypothetical protein